MQEYNITDRQLHWLSQAIAKMNRTFVPVKEDDSHTNLSFDAIGGRIFGRWIDTPKGKIILAFNLDYQHFEWLNQNLHILTKVPVFSTDLEIIEKNISEYLVSIDMDTSDIPKPLHFELPDYKINQISEGELTIQGIKLWKHYRELANNACLSMLSYLQKESEIRIWPHHFDTGIYAQISELLGLGFGLAMEDSLIGEPYFYLAGYYSGSPIKYENLPRLDSGKWVTGEHWNGAVLTFSEINGLSFGNVLSTMKKYIEQTADWFLSY
jgi:hypothetical protein